MRKYDCIFFDRDGTINHDPGYISKLKDFIFFEFTISALKLLVSITNKFIIITNQSGVSRGLIKENDLLRINDFIMNELKKNKLPLLKIYYCTDHPDHATDRRKPGSGMFLVCKYLTTFFSLIISLFFLNFLKAFKSSNLDP